MSSTDNKQDEIYNSLSVEKLNIGTYQLPTTDGTANQVLTTNGSGVVTWGGLVNNGNVLYGKNVTSQTTNLAVTDHIKFDTVLFSTGSNISLNTSSPYTTTTGAASIGRITLAANKTYLLDLWLVQFNATTLVVNWWNATSNAAIDGPIAGTFPGCTAVFTPGVSTLVEVRIVNSTLPNSISRTSVRVIQLSN